MHQRDNQSKSTQSEPNALLVSTADLKPMPLLLSSAYNPSRAHGLSPFNNFSGKEHSLRWIRPPVFVKCDEYWVINAICSTINRRQPADNPAPPRAHRPHGSSCNQIDQPDTTKENQPTRSQISYAEEIYSTPTQDTEHGNNQVE
ncbi:hypothetical protein ACMD2_27213 [Ananas comosus]|uniref:Uncharacterized protein n=1 Tax=Ananas comosus TaxID=4615 RepID=A0A199UYT7_ANACO|nr:hypothetical protein ACMD2_27213 [Ananas comosus]